METVWERRRLKRETLEPEEMHTVSGGAIRTLAGLGPWTYQTHMNLCPLCQSGSYTLWPKHAGYSYFIAVYLAPALILLLHFCLFLFASWASFFKNQILSRIY